MLFAATWMDLEIIILSAVSQTEKDRYHMISIYHVIDSVWNLKKMIQMNLLMKQKKTHRHRKQIYDYQRGKGGGGKQG